MTRLISKSYTDKRKSLLINKIKIIEILGYFLEIYTFGKMLIF